jgi:hypothetical protein
MHTPLFSAAGSDTSGMFTQPAHGESNPASGLSGFGSAGTPNMWQPCFVPEPPTPMDDTPQHPQRMRDQPATNPGPVPDMSSGMDDARTSAAVFRQQLVAKCSFELHEWAGRNRKFPTFEEAHSLIAKGPRDFLSTCPVTLTQLLIDIVEHTQRPEFRRYVFSHPPTQESLDARIVKVSGALMSIISAVDTSATVVPSLVTMAVLDVMGGDQVVNVVAKYFGHGPDKVKAWHEFRDVDSTLMFTRQDGLVTFSGDNYGQHKMVQKACQAWLKLKVQVRCAMVSYLLSATNFIQYHDSAAPKLWLPRYSGNPMILTQGDQQLLNDARDRWHLSFSQEARHILQTNSGVDPAIQWAEVEVIEESTKKRWCFECSKWQGPTDKGGAALKCKGCNKLLSKTKQEVLEIRCEQTMQWHYIHFKKLGNQFDESWFSPFEVREADGDCDAEVGNPQLRIGTSSKDRVVKIVERRSHPCGDYDPAFYASQVQIMDQVKLRNSEAAKGLDETQFYSMDIPASM